MRNLGFISRVEVRRKYKRVQGEGRLLLCSLHFSSLPSELLYALLCPGPLLTHPLWSSVEFSIGISLSEEKLVFLWLHCNYPREGLCAILEPPQVTSAVVALAAAAWVVTRWRPVPHFYESNLSGRGQSLQTGLCKRGWERVRCSLIVESCSQECLLGSRGSVPAGGKSMAPSPHVFLFLARSVFYFREQFKNQQKIP